MASSNRATPHPSTGAKWEPVFLRINEARKAATSAALTRNVHRIPPPNEPLRRSGEKAGIMLFTSNDEISDLDGR